MNWIIKIRQKIEDKACKQLFIGLFAAFCSMVYCNAQEVKPSPKPQPFSNRITHSFGFQYNNCIYPKGKFVYTNNNPSLGYDPLTSYGTEWLVKYNQTLPSGFGFSLEAMYGTISRKTNDRFLQKKDGDIDMLTLLLLAPIMHNYWGFNIKGTYMRQITPFLFIQPEIGLKLPYYVPFISSASLEIEGVPASYMEYHNDNCKRIFFPDITTGINFLFHTKRNPRNNFIVGLNLNIGLTPRYKGFYSITPPDFTREDAKITYSSTFIGINFGYEFTGVPNTYDRKAARMARKAVLSSRTFDFTQPVHSIGFILNSGLSVPYQAKRIKGEITPISRSSYVPELAIQYNCAIAHGWGVAVAIPIGVMRQDFSVSPWLFLEDFVWPNGVIDGEGFPSDEVNLPLFYSGAAINASYTAAIHKNMWIRPEIGLKFVPFLMQNIDFDVIKAAVYDENTPEEQRYDLVYEQLQIKMPKSYNAIPDLVIAVNFMIHGKNIAHNFIFGLNAQICFVDRLEVAYHTTDIVPAERQSSGILGLRSTFIGFHVGYQFMKGKEQERN